MLNVVLATILAQAPVAGAVILEPRFETLRYRFENPSSFNTTELVPHFFEQTYDTDHFWIGGALRFSLAGHPAEFRGALTPQVTAQADDFDTFYQPDGSVVVSGTTGNASLRGWTVRQRVQIDNSGDLAYGIGYVYRHDSADFQEGTRVVTVTLPPSETRELVTTREFVTSHIHQVIVYGEWRSSGARGFSVLLDAAPVTSGRLRIQLPDKYPGQTLKFNANVSSFAAEARLDGFIAKLRTGGGLRVEHTLQWRDSAQLHVTSLSLLFHLGTR